MTKCVSDNGKRWDQQRLSRRQFAALAGSTIAAGAGIFSLGVGAVHAAAVGDAAAPLLDIAAFTRCVGQQFRVAGPHGPVIVKLASVTASHASLPRGTAARNNASAFSLQFQAPPVGLLPQRTFTFQHAHLGTFSIFIVPMGVNKGLAYYEAIFNRLPTSH